MKHPIQVKEIHEKITSLSEENKLQSEQAEETRLSLHHRCEAVSNNVRTVRRNILERKRIVTAHPVYIHLQDSY